MSWSCATYPYAVYNNDLHLHSSQNQGLNYHVFCPYQGMQPFTGVPPYPPGWMGTVNSSGWQKMEEDTRQAQRQNAHDNARCRMNPHAYERWAETENQQEIEHCNQYKHMRIPGNPYMRFRKLRGRFPFQRQVSLKASGSFNPNAQSFQPGISSGLNGRSANAASVSISKPQGGSSQPRNTNQTDKSKSKTLPASSSGSHNELTQAQLAAVPKSSQWAATVPISESQQGPYCLPTANPVKKSQPDVFDAAFGSQPHTELDTTQLATEPKPGRRATPAFNDGPGEGPSQSKNAKPADKSKPDTLLAFSSKPQAEFIFDSKPWRREAPALNHGNGEGPSQPQNVNPAVNSQPLAARASSFDLVAELMKNSLTMNWKNSSSKPTKWPAPVSKRDPWSASVDLKCR